MALLSMVVCGRGRPSEWRFGNRERAPFVSLRRREAGTGAVETDAVVFTDVQVFVGSMPTLAE